MNRKNEWRVLMDRELEDLLEKSRVRNLSDEQLEEHRIAMAVANGSLSDDRITIETMKAGMTVVAASKLKEK